MGARFNSDPASLTYQNETLPPLTSMGANALVSGAAEFLSGAPTLAAEAGESLQSHFSAQHLLFQGVRIKFLVSIAPG